MGDSDLKPNLPSQWVAFRWPLTIVLLGLMILAGFAWFLWFLTRSVEKTGEKGAEVVRVAGGAAAKAAEKFMKGTITQTFTAAIPTLSHTSGGSLELAAAHTTETFTRSNAKTVMWDWVYLGTTISEIKVPVTYRYHMRLADSWRLDVSGNTCLVYCPEMQATLPPAIDTEGMEKRSERGWARFNAGEQMTDLEKNITPTLNRYAMDRRHRELVKEECRKTVADFVRTWLLKEDQWRKDRFHTIKVIFPAEAELKLEQVPPVLELKN
jgi:hypothetical protein